MTLDQVIGGSNPPSPAVGPLTSSRVHHSRRDPDRAGPISRRTDGWLGGSPRGRGRTRERDRIIGTVQLRLALLPNSRHRAEVAKLLVHRDARRRGVARRLLAAIDKIARREGRTLLVLDTISGSEADRLYRSLGWSEVGSVPNYAAMPDGVLAATTFFYREL
ncbi:MAG: GNAT family N-acetyltransferase [Chloroflexi bacterium]|nr:MAG: GNAT family N-acetyltransferase [Chloroflexota bacterium]